MTFPLLSALSLALSLAAMTILWLVSLNARDVSIVDRFWGPGFVLVAWLCTGLASAPTPRAWGVAAAVSVWGLRLGWHIHRRNRGGGEDFRYRAMREKRGPGFAVQSLWIVFWLQGLLLWVISMPVQRAIHSPAPESLGTLDALGALLFAVGLLFEVVADRQLARFRADPANRGRVLDTGLWRYTRHPNYFGEAVLWWGLGAMAAATPGGAWTLLGPALLTFLLLRVSGVALLEKTLSSTKPRYRDYVRRTSAFFPWPPRRSSGDRAG